MDPVTTAPIESPSPTTAPLPNVRGAGPWRRLAQIVALLLVMAPAGGCGSSTSDESSSGAGETASTGAATGGSGESEGASEGGATDPGTSSSGGGSGSGCLPPTVEDDFSGGEVDPTRWMIDASTGMTIEVVDGRLVFAPIADFNNTRNVALRLLAAYDLTECATWVEVPRPLPQDVNGELFSVVGIDAQSRAIIRVLGPNIYFQVVIGDDVAEVWVPHDAAAHRWWRVRDEAGILYLETSSTGKDWTTQLEKSHALDLSAVTFSLAMHTSGINDTFDGPQFDNVNVRP